MLFALAARPLSPALTYKKELKRDDATSLNGSMRRPVLPFSTNAGTDGVTADGFFARRDAGAPSLVLTPY